ncbi:MAG TPA: FkbM family methyltransferase [Solirubrobacteraceae bacterium]|nr:FkbM family methyltransferase [Solirubrobacteraceae bacterium]
MRRAVLQVLRRLFPKLMLKRALSRDQWNEIEEELLPAVVDPARVAVDVGAHAGSYTVRLAEIAPKVFAFEPDTEMAALIERGTPGHVVVSSEAVSDTVGVKTFRVPVEAGHASVTLGSLAPLDTTSTIDREVKTTTLDRLADEDIGFVKIDVEGHEAEVLAGGRELLRRRRPVFLLEANDAADVSRLVEFFANEDYAGFFVHPDGGTALIEELTPELQDRAELSKPVTRREMRFVNNFFYAPRGEADELRRRLEAAR